MPHQFGGGSREVIHHIHDAFITRACWSVLLGAMHQVPAGPCDVFHMDAAEHLARLVDQAGPPLLQAVEHRPAWSINAW